MAAELLSRAETEGEFANEGDIPIPRSYREAVEYPVYGRNGPKRFIMKLLPQSSLVPGG